MPSYGGSVVFSCPDLTCVWVVSFHIASEETVCVSSPTSRKQLHGLFSFHGPISRASQPIHILLHPASTLLHRQQATESIYKFHQTQAGSEVSIPQRLGWLCKDCTIIVSVLGSNHSWRLQARKDLGTRIRVALLSPTTHTGNTGRALAAIDQWEMLIAGLW